MSTSTASAARCVLTASRSSRWRRSSASASAPMPSPLGDRRRCAHLRVGHAARSSPRRPARRRRRCRDPRSRSRRGAEHALALAHHLAHLRGDGRRPGRRASIAGSRIDVVTSIPSIATRPRSSERPRGWPARERRELGAVVERELALEREPGERAVHRPGVEVAEAEPLRERAGDGALAGARPGRRWRRSRGRLDAREASRAARRSRGSSLPRRQHPRSARPRWEARPAIAPSIAIRWSPWRRQPTAA